VRAGNPSGTQPWNPTLAQKTRKDGAPGTRHLNQALCSGLKGCGETVRAGIASGTQPWNPTLAQKMRKDGAPGPRPVEIGKGAQFRRQ